MCRRGWPQAYRARGAEGAPPATGAGTDAGHRAPSPSQGCQYHTPPVLYSVIHYRFSSSLELNAQHCTKKILYIILYCYAAKAAFLTVLIYIQVLVEGDIFLNTSLTEAFCIAIVEAASCG